LAWADAHNPFFVHGKHGKLGKFCRVAALTDEPALPKFLRAKTGFTQLRRRRYGAPAARRHEAGFPLPSPKKKKFKKILKNEKGFQGQQLAHLFFENLSQKTRFWVIVDENFL
jgi:hypothetical protein